MAVRRSVRTLQEYNDAFLRSLRGRRAETRGTYQRALREFLRWCEAANGFRFRMVDVEEYKRYLSEDKRLAKASVSTYLTALRRLCDFLVRKQILRNNPAKHVAGNSRPTGHRRQALTAEQVQHLLASIPRIGELGQRDFAIVKLMVSSGLSEIEIVRADREDVKSIDGKLLLAVQGKGRSAKDEAVPLTEDTAEALNAYVALRGNTPGALFTSAGNRVSGQRLTTRAVRQRVTSHMEAAGVRDGRHKRVSPDSLRHTAAATMARAGASVSEIRQRMRLGTDSTAQLYVNQNTH